MSFTLVARVGEGFWAGQGIDALAQHSSMAAAFHREIIHNGFGGNPRVPGGITKQIWISQQFFLGWSSGYSAVSEEPFC